MRLEIVLIDQEPLRCATADDCSDVMARLEDARAGWRRFEDQDKPAFARWRAREFGALLSEAREVEVAIRDKQTLIDEVEMEMRRGFQDAHTAWRRVMARRGHPTAIPEPEPEPVYADTADNGVARKVSEFEQEALFQEWVQRALGTNPDKMDDDAYTTTFEAFKAHMFRPRAEEPMLQNTTRARAQPHVLAEPDEEDEHAAVDARVKELYRILVRRLHPDLRADGSAAVSALWHEVQEAYAANDVAQLELLLAVSDIRRDPMNDKTLSEMRSIVLELSRALRALEMSLEEAEREDAWDFARTGANEHLHARVERELKANLARRSSRLDLLTRTIADWARGPAAVRARDRQFAW